VRSFRRFAARWPISVLCITVLIAPLAGTALAPLPALAQTGTIEVAVVDFRNVSKVSNEMFGAMATDAVVVELLRCGKFGVVTADTLQAKMEELGYKSKEDRALKVHLTPSMMVRVGGEVGADSVVSGEVTSIKVDRGKKRAEARIVVRMLDVASGEWVNGAVATGASNPRIGYTPDRDTDWIIEAINSAARKAVETMVQYIIPEATIIGTIGPNEVLLNRGSQEGLEPGMEMIVLRRGDAGEEEVVGRVRISKVSDTDSRASVVRSTRGVKPEDRVRAVYELPKDTGGKEVEAPRTDSKKRIAVGSKLLWGLVTLIGIATFFKGGGDRPEQLPTAVVMAGRSPDVTAATEDGGILIAWNNPKDVRHADVIEFHVWRDNHGNWGSGAGGEAGSNLGPVMANDMVTAAPLNGPAGSFDHMCVDFTYPKDFDYLRASADHTDLDEGSLEPMMGISIGVPHQYWVTCLYRRFQPTTGTTTGTEDNVTYWETSAIYAGRATYVTRPIPESPGGTTGTTYVDLTNVTFVWRGSRGADQYVIEVSTVPDFNREQTWVRQEYQPTGTDGERFTRTYTNVLKNAQGVVVPELAGAPPGATLYWRVGARNSQDVPGPYPALPTPVSNGPKNTRYMYTGQGDIFMFMTLPDMPEPPPDQPGDGDGGEGPPPPPPI